MHADTHSPASHFIRIAWPSSDGLCAILPITIHLWSQRVDRRLWINNIYHFTRILLRVWWQPFGADWSRVKCTTNETETNSSIPDFQMGMGFCIASFSPLQCANTNAIGVRRGRGRRRTKFATYVRFFRLFDFFKVQFKSLFILMRKYIWNGMKCILISCLFSVRRSFTLLLLLLLQLKF